MRDIESEKGSIFQSNSEVSILIFNKEFNYIISMDSFAIRMDFIPPPLSLSIPYPLRLSVSICNCLPLSRAFFLASPLTY